LPYFSKSDFNHARPNKIISLVGFTKEWNCGLKADRFEIITTRKGRILP
jgi:hypothetical protein